MDMTTDILVVIEQELNKLLTDSTLRGVPYAIVLTAQNEIHRSLTLNILYGAPQGNYMRTQLKLQRKLCTLMKRRNSQNYSPKNDCVCQLEPNLRKTRWSSVLNAASLLDMISIIYAAQRTGFCLRI